MMKLSRLSAIYDIINRISRRCNAKPGWRMYRISLIYAMKINEEIVIASNFGNLCNCSDNHVTSYIDDFLGTS